PSAPWRSASPTSPDGPTTPPPTTTTATTPPTPYANSVSPDEHASRLGQSRSQPLPTPGSRRDLRQRPTPSQGGRGYRVRRPARRMPGQALAAVPLLLRMLRGAGSKA